MEATIFDWAGEAKDKLEKLGFKHKQVLNVSHGGFWGTVEKLNHAGLSVMIDGDVGSNNRTIFVDKIGGKFRQR